MKIKIVYIERKMSEAVSLEKVFRQIKKNISKKNFETSFTQLPYFSQISGIIKNIFFFRKPPADIYHITGDIHYISLLLPPDRTVLTIHDLRFIHFRKGLRRFFLKKLFLDFPIKHLKYITAISEATKKEIISFTGCPDNKIRVIQNPLREEFCKISNKKFDEECPIILQIGTSPNKNVDNLVKALKGINCRLKIIGRIDAKLENELAINKINFDQAFNINDEQIMKEYSNADIVSFCSTYEGFGLPIIEAQAIGKAVITSNISPLREVAGGAAVLVNPEEIEEISSGVLKIINDREFRDDIIRKGIENSQRFVPEAIAELYENLYQEIINARIN